MTEQEREREYVILMGGGGLRQQQQEVFRSTDISLCAKFAKTLFYQEFADRQQEFVLSQIDSSCWSISTRQPSDVETLYFTTYFVYKIPNNSSPLQWATLDFTPAP